MLLALRYETLSKDTPGRLRLEVNLGMMSPEPKLSLATSIHCQPSTQPSAAARTGVYHVNRRSLRRNIMLSTVRSKQAWMPRSGSRDPSKRLFDRPIVARRHVWDCAALVWGQGFLFPLKGASCQPSSGRLKMMRAWRTATRSMLTATSPAFPKGVHRRRKSHHECDDSDDCLDRHFHSVGQSWILVRLSGQKNTGGLVGTGKPPLRRCVGLS